MSREKGEKRKISCYYTFEDIRCRTRVMCLVGVQVVDCIGDGRIIDVDDVVSQTPSCR